MKQHTKGRHTRSDMLEFIETFIDENGYSPNYREIGNQLGFAPSVVKYHLERLERQGKVTRVPGRARTLRIL